MVDFQLPEDIFSQIKEHAINMAPQECCGVILIKKGRRKYYPCDNVSKEPDSFIINSIQYTRLSLQGDIEFIVHSHTTGNDPSEHDIQACESLKIPYLIYYIETDTYSIHCHKNYNKLIGRDYIFGKQDCFEAARDWFLTHNIIMPPRKNWLDNDQDTNYNYMENEVMEWPVEQVQDLKYGDILLLSVFSKKPNHIAIYLDNDIIFHHAVNRLSCRENMYPYWAENIYGIYRFKRSDLRRISW
jgi:proteasome lid subunit RPN8/RPN11